MRIVPLAKNTPQQSSTFTEDNDFYEVSLRNVDNITTITIKRNGDILVQGKRCVDRCFLLPQYKEAGRGNLAFWNDDKNYPVYTDFGITTFLIYYSPDDMKEAAQK